MYLSLYYIKINIFLFTFLPYNLIAVQPKKKKIIKTIINYIFKTLQFVFAS